MFKTTRRAAAIFAACALSFAVQAQSFPSKQVTLMVPYPAGGASDVIARMFNQPFSQQINQPVLVENLGGAGGAIAAQKVLDAPHDGYQVFQGSPNELVLSPLAIKAVKYKPEQWRALQVIADAPIAIFTRPGLEAASADELVALAKKQAAAGKPMSYASVGIGTFYHLIGEELSQKINAPMLHVPYKGAADIVKDLIGNQVDIFISPYAAPHVAMAKAGRLKIIGALSAKRQRMIPDVATVDEGLALKGWHKSIWTGYFVPADTPEAVAQALHKGITGALNDPKLKAAFDAQNMDINPVHSLADAQKQYVQGTAEFTKIFKSIKIEAQ